MSRLFWMGVGGTLAIVGARRARQRLDPVLTAAGPVTDWVGTIQAKLAEFRTAMAEQEAYLKATFVENISGPDNPAPNPRTQDRTSWATETRDPWDLPDDDEDGDEPYSF